MPLVRNYSFVFNGTVQCVETGQALLKSSETVFQVESDIVAHFPLDAIRSIMLINGIKYVEQAYVGQFDTDGKYAVFQYNEVIRYTDDTVNAESKKLVYLSEKSYKPDFFDFPELRDDMQYRRIK